IAIQCQWTLLTKKHPNPRVMTISMTLGFFFFNDTATTEIYTLSLHDALPISPCGVRAAPRSPRSSPAGPSNARSEEHTSELQSRSDLVCRLLLETKNTSSATNTCRCTSNTIRTTHGSSPTT